MLKVKIIHAFKTDDVTEDEKVCRPWEYNCTDKIRGKIILSI